MKNKSYLLVFLFWVLASYVLGQGSWLDVQVQTDQYAGETSWEILNEDSEVVAASPPYQNNTFQNHMVFLPSGDYKFVMMDAFGDVVQNKQYMWIRYSSV